MGYIKHQAIIVIDHGYGDGIDRAHAQAIQIYDLQSPQVSSITRSVINGYRSFYVAPDGSKEGWEDSRVGDDNRTALKVWLDGNREELGYVDYVEVSAFGGDDNQPAITDKSKECDESGE